jgi:hypothetical protein
VGWGWKATYRVNATGEKINLVDIFKATQKTSIFAENEIDTNKKIKLK